MSEPRLTYCFDTSSLLEPWNHRYPVEHFPSFWNAMDGLIREKRMIATEEVREEIFRIDDGLTQKIPEVCAALSIQCTNILGVIRCEGWRF